MSRPSGTRFFGLLTALLVGLSSSLAMAQDAPAAASPAAVKPVDDKLPAYQPSSPPTDRTELLPPDLQGANIDETNLGQTIPLDLDFFDENGRAVKLSDYFRDGRPVILQMAYYRCPMLCPLVLDSMSNTIEEMDWLPGEDYQVITVSIDPRERPKDAMERKREVFLTLDEDAAAGWAFLTGRDEDIRSLADSVGFQYRYIERQDEYSHAAGIMVLSPEGRISRYFVMLKYPARTLRLSLVEAGEGKVGSTLDRILLTCFQYDAAEGRYVPVAMGLMKLGGAVTVTALGLLVGLMFAFEAVRRRSRDQVKSA
ncbi:MAG: SCO family protein [Phycisphaeraceae bacterium]